LRGNFFFVRGTTECVLEVGDRVLHRARPRANRTGHPVERPQAVEDRTADARHGVRLELHAMIGIEFVDCVHQPEHARAHEIGRVDRLRQTGAETAGHELHETRVVDDEPFTGTRFAFSCPMRPGRVQRVSTWASLHRRVVEGWSTHAGSDQARGCEAR
jgi:hypothetical protein